MVKNFRLEQRPTFDWATTFTFLLNNSERLPHMAYLGITNLRIGNVSEAKHTKRSTDAVPFYSIRVYWNYRI